jgi:hypothetical protein
MMVNVHVLCVNGDIHVAAHLFIRLDCRRQTAASKSPFISMAACLGFCVGLYDSD